MEGSIIPDIVPLSANYLEEAVAADEEAKKPKRKKKLTKEEKAELKKQRAIDYQKLELSAKLKKELKLSKRSYWLQYSKWQELCGTLKLEEFKKELELWIEKTNRWVEDKDLKIQNLLNDIDESLELNHRATSKRVELIDYLTETYDIMVDAADLSYETQVEDVLQTHLREMFERDYHQDLFHRHCGNIITSSVQINTHEIRDDYENFVTKEIEVISLEIEQRYIRRSAILKIMKYLRKRVLHFVNLLNDTSLDAEKFERLHMLTHRSRIFSAESRRLNRIEHRYLRMLTNMNRNHILSEMRHRRCYNDLKLELSYYVRIRRGVEGKVDDERAITFEKIKVLTNTTVGIKKELARKERYGELLLALAANCRKLETQTEKIMISGDFPLCFSLVDDEKFYLDCINLKDILDLSEKDFHKKFHLLKHFWRRMSIIQTQNTLLNIRKNKLLEKKENYLEYIRSLTKTDNPETLRKLLIVKPGIKEPKVYPCDKYTIRD